MPNIFDWFRGRSKVARKASELYGSIVTQARDPHFYTHFRVPDVAAKRYELVVLHIVLVLGRLREVNAAGGDLARELVEAFVSDLDGSIREMALGDTKVPANVRAAAAGLLERDRLYREAFDDGAAARDDAALCALIADLVFDDAEPAAARGLARYVEASRDLIGAWDPDSAMGSLVFAEPDRFSLGTTDG